MSYDLTSESGGELNFSSAGWALILNVAEAYGWKPHGTEPPEDISPAEWDGQYDSCDGQRVSSDDAAALAEALARALGDPNRAEKERQIGRELNKELRRMEIEAFGEDVAAEPEPELVTTDDDTLRALIGFLRAGAFTIN